MYEDFFGLSRRPFPAVAQADQYFAAASIDGARATLSRCIERGEGIGVVIGPSGTGKTLLCQLLAAQFEKKLHVVLLTAGQFSSRRALFQAILYELKQPYRGLDEGEARLALSEFLSRDESGSAGLLLLVDEAHTMPLRLIDEVRTLTNVGRQGQMQVRLVLAGGPTLEERLASPKLESLSQRITARCYLEAFQKSETQQYVQTRINLSGGNGPRVFSDATCQAIHRATDGVPRLINQVCDHALLLACARGDRSIEPALIEEAWADLQQLPMPWNGEPTGPAESVIEFGTLDDDAPGPADGNSDENVRSTSPSAWAGECESMFDDDEDATVRTEQDVDRIETMLSEADDQFRPPGPAPEIELVFDEPGHPFAERFEREETVVDRYARSPRGASQATMAAPHRARVEPAEPETVPLRCDQDDAPILIVEDGYDHATLPVCRIAPVRRNEFCQLFTRLRRGAS